MPKNLFNASHEYFELKMLIPEQDAQNRVKGFRRQLRVEELNAQNELEKIMAFDWIIIDHDDKEIQMQLYFKNAHKISRSGVKDQIDISFLQPENFTTTAGKPLKLLKRSGQGLSLRDLNFDLPTYLSKKNQNIIAKSTATITTCITVTALGFVMTILFGGSLGLFWGLIKGIQFTTFLCLVNIWFPANSEFFLESEMLIASIDVYGG